MRYVLLFLLILFASTGCKKMILNKTEKQLAEGEWMIYLYSEDGKNLTDKGYSEYTFTFNGDGNMNARISTLGVNLTGIYEMVKLDKLVVMRLTVQSPLDSINEDWEITDQNKSKVELRTNNVKNKRLVFLKKK
jgi:hypothetical protein